MTKLTNLINDYPTFTYKTAISYGFSSYEIKKLESDGTIRKYDRGVFVFSGHYFDELSLLTQKFSRGVISLVSALIVYDLTDEMPLQTQLTFPQGYHPNTSTIVKYNIDSRYLTEPKYKLGVVTTKNENGGLIRIYSRERTLIEVWESNAIQNYIKNDALKKYLLKNPDTEELNSLLQLSNSLYPKSNLLKTMEVMLQ